MQRKTRVHKGQMPPSDIMNPTSVSQSKLDPVAELLKDLAAGKKVTKEKATAALQHYNKFQRNINEEDGTDKVYRSIEKNQLEVQEKREEIANLKIKLKEQTSRLSEVAGKKFSTGNPDLADLSDPYRPTCLAESFSQLYDDEWTLAFEDLEKAKKPEKDAIGCLAEILQDADKFCEEAASEQLKKMSFQNKVVIDELTGPKYTKKGYSDPVTSSTKYELNIEEEEIIEVHVKQLRKSLARTSVTGLTQIFAKCFLIKRVPDNISPCAGFDAFVKKAVSLLWMMKIQDTPMVLTWAKAQDKFDRNKHTQYTRKGEIIEYPVWPGVLLHTGGPLMAKGVVQCKTT